MVKKPNGEMGYSKLFLTIKRKYRNEMAKKGSAVLTDKIIGIEQQGKRTVEVIAILADGVDTGKRLYRRIITNRIHAKGQRVYQSK